MFISVVLPAPFSPTSPWIEPRATTRSTSRFAAFVPKLLLMPRSSTAGTLPSLVGAGIVGAPIVGAAGLARLGRHVVGDLDLAGDDVGLGGLELGRHLRGDQRGVVGIDGIGDAVFGEAD